MNLEDIITKYGRTALIPIDCLPQILFYTRHGKQPVFVYENEKKQGRITAWFLKNETSEVYELWKNNSK